MKVKLGIMTNWWPRIAILGILLSAPVGCILTEDQLDQLTVAPPEANGGWQVSPESVREVALVPPGVHSDLQCAFGPGSLFLTLVGRRTYGELVSLPLGGGKGTTVRIPEPDGTELPQFQDLFSKPVLMVDRQSNAFMYWSISSNGSHAFAYLARNQETPGVSRQTRPTIYLEDMSKPIFSPNGSCYLLNWSANFYQPFELRIFELEGRARAVQIGSHSSLGRASHRILDAAFISDQVLHMVWADIDDQSSGLLRILTIDFNVERREWSSEVELFRFRNTKIGSTPTVLSKLGEPRQYFWDFSGFYKIRDGQGSFSGGGPILFRSEKSPRTFRVADDHEAYKVISVGEKSVLAYSRREEPWNVFFRVIEGENFGPTIRVTLKPEMQFVLRDNRFLLGSNGKDKVWIAQTTEGGRIYSIDLVHRP